MPIDLIRNAVFLTVGSDPEAVDHIYKEHWDPFEQELGLDYQEKFINPYAAIRDPSITQPTLYSKHGSIGMRRCMRSCLNQRPA